MKTDFCLYSSLHYNEITCNSILKGEQIHKDCLSDILRLEGVPEKASPILWYDGLLERQEKSIIQTDTSFQISSGRINFTDCFRCEEIEPVGFERYFKFRVYRNLKTI